MMLSKEERYQLESEILNSITDNKDAILLALKMSVTVETFSSPAHSCIYKIMIDYFHQNGRAADSVELFRYLLTNGNQITNELKEQIKKVLAKLNTNAIGQVDKLILRFFDDNIEKEIKCAIEKSSMESQMGLDYGMNLIQNISQAIEKHIGITNTRKSNQESIEEYLKKVEDIRCGLNSDFIPTSISKLDRNIIGIRKGHLSVFAARPGMGKTTFALFLMSKLLKQGLKVGFFSIEMDKENLLSRLLSNLCGIDSLRIERGELNADEMEKITQCSNFFSNDNYIIDDSPCQTIESIIAKIKIWQLKELADLIIIDYLTLIKSDRRKDRYDLEIASLTTELRIFAKSSGIPIIIISQLNRLSDQRKDKRPCMSDLRESGSIEQDANLVLLLHRPAYYEIDPFKKMSRTPITLTGDQLDPNEFLELIIAKARNGKTGVVPLRYIASLHQFEEVKYK